MSCVLVAFMRTLPLLRGENITPSCILKTWHLIVTLLISKGTNRAEHH